MKAVPKADIGSDSHAPSAPTARLRPASAPWRPPASPARIASAAASPGGHAPVGREDAAAEQAIQQRTRRGTSPRRRRRASAARGPARPSRYGTPIGSSSELAAPKVAADIALCARFCACIERKTRSPATGRRPSSIASSAPMSEVFGVTPSDVSSCTPMTAPSGAHEQRAAGGPAGKAPSGVRTARTPPSQRASALPTSGRLSAVATLVRSWSHLSRENLRLDPGRSTPYAR